MKTLILGLSTLTILSIAACGGSVQTGTGGAGGSGNTGTSNNSTGTSTLTGNDTTSAGTGVPGGCPVAEPTNGSSCAGVMDGRQCTYGQSTRPECRDVWMCKGGMWNTTGSLCAMPIDCGTTEPSMGTVCPNEGEVCVFGSDICVCSSCPGGPCMAPPPKWTCAGPPTTAGCPSIAPNNGTACFQSGLSCTYGFPCGSSGVTAECKDGVWTWDSTVACPD